MKKILDLTLPIRPHWRWKTEVTRTKEHEKGDYGQYSWIKISAHSFTHVDSPLHNLPQGAELSNVPLSNYYGDTAVVDVSFRGANEEITAKDLEANGRHISRGDIALIKTNWQLKSNWESREFWDYNPFLGMGGVRWLIAQGVKAVAFDFPFTTHPEHEEFFRAGVVLIEYLTNVDKITQERIQIYALPLNIEYKFEGAPARVITFIDD